MSDIDRNFTILIDSREKLPYFFADYTCGFKRAGLHTGDYSIEGYESQIAIERKSKEDLYMSLGRERDRFEREFQRLSKFEYAALIIESSLSGLLKPPARSQMKPMAVIQSLISWSIRYGVNIYFADSRKLAESLIYSICEKFIYNKIKNTA